MSVWGQSKHYEIGQKALQSQQWSEAIKAFKAVKNEAPDLEDAALYWQGYAEYKNGQKKSAERTLKKLLKKYPDSAWKDDSKILLQEHKAQIPQQDMDEELRLYAIQQLAIQNPEKGLPLIIQVLESSNSVETKQNALHILSINNSSKSTEYLKRFIERENNTELKVHSIQMLGLRGDSKNTQFLSKIYKKNTNKPVKEAIISTFLHNNNTQFLTQLLKQETDDDLSRHMIHMLGINGHNDSLKKLYQQRSSHRQKSAILHALAISGDTDAIKKIIDTEGDKKIRISAIQSLIVADDGSLDNYILKQYKKTEDREEKRALIDLLIATDINAKTLYNMALDESDKHLRKHLLNNLMVLEQPDFLMQLYDNDSMSEHKKDIIHAIAAIDGTDQLIGLYAKENNEAIQSTIIEALAIHNGPLIEKTLIDIYQTPKQSKKLKSSVLNTLMVQSNNEALMQLFKKEQDAQLKKQIIQILSISGSDELLEKIINNQE